MYYHSQISQMTRFKNYPHGYTSAYREKDIPPKFIPYIDDARLSAAHYTPNDAPNRLKVNSVLGELARMASELDDWDTNERHQRETIHLAMDFVAKHFESFGL